MTKVTITTIIIIIISSFVVRSQVNPDSLISKSNESYSHREIIKGILLDSESKEPLPYANIYVLNKTKGVISNETGCFTIDISELDKSDTLRFQYIGYKKTDIIISELDTSSIIYLKEEIIKLSETLVFGNPPDPEKIVKKVLENKDSNYIKTTSKKQTFIRKRYISDINQLTINYKKSSVSGVDRKMISNLEKGIPKHNVSFTDFLGNLYFSKYDSAKLKIEAIKSVKLKEKELASVYQIESDINNILLDINEKEYWKVKSGIIGVKVDEENENENNNDSINNKPIQDTIIESSNRKLKYFRSNVNNKLRFCSLENEDEWEFLHKTGRYNYILEGGSHINGEDVYIISFSPKFNGDFIGRLYISTSTYALIRADYEYAQDKTGVDFNLLGIGYTENLFHGSVYFEKKDDTYRLKYFSKKTGDIIKINRSLSLIKKRKRRFFDKKISQIKIGLDFEMTSEESFEMFVVSDEEISESYYTDIIQKESMEIILVDQFNDELWKGYSIIEPTKQMKDYKKHR